MRKLDNLHIVPLYGFLYFKIHTYLLSEIFRLNSDRQQKVATANRLFQQMLFRYQGHIGAYLILGGVDFHGPHLFTIHAHGSASKVPYTAMGSGSLAAIAVLEENWKEKLSEEEAKKLVCDAFFI